jgi:hypothetical protein
VLIAEEMNAAALPTSVGGFAMGTAERMYALFDHALDRAPGESRGG